MKNYAIITDSTSDLPLELREKYTIDYVMMNYVIDDVEYPASLDWESHSAKEYYDIMRGGKRAYTTQVPRSTYEEKFRSYIEQDYDMIYISCSSALSGSINIARIVAKELTEQFPDSKIYCVDSLISSLGQAHQAITASKMRTEGKSVDEVFAFLEENKLKVNQCGTVESLEYLRRAGRVKASSAFFGNIFGVKPIIISDRIGQNFAIKKVKGTANALQSIAQEICDAADGNYETLYISHADNPELAAKLQEAILAIAPFTEVVSGIIGPIVGASVGPGTIIAFCYGKEVTIEGSV